MGQRGCWLVVRVCKGWMKRGVIEKANDFEPKGKQRDVFGDGKAGEVIVKIIGEEKWIR